MGKVVLKTVQDARCLDSILSGTYKPDFGMSFGSFDELCTESYRYVLDVLSKKTNKLYEFGKDTCIWSWYWNPFFKNHITCKNIGVDLVVITFEIDEEDVVFLDFDIWCDKIIDGYDVNPIVNIHNVDKDSCIQAVSWGIPVDGVLDVKPFNEYLKELYNE